MRNIDRGRYIQNSVPWTGVLHPRNLFFLGTQSYQYIRDVIPWYLQGAFDSLIIAGLSRYGTLRALYYFDGTTENVPTIGGIPGPEVLKIVNKNVKQSMLTSRPFEKDSLKDQMAGPLSKRLKLNNREANYTYMPGAYAGQAGYKTSIGKKSNVKINHKVHKEIAGSISDSELVYLLIGPNYRSIMEEIFKQVVKCLLNQSGFQFQNWDNVLGVADVVFVIQYQLYIGIADIAPTAYSFQITTMTPRAIATQLQAHISTNVGTVSTCWFHNIQLISRDTDAAFATKPDSIVGQITPYGIKIRIDVSQALLMQNQSKSGTTTSSDDIKQSANAVSSNPLNARIYNVNGNVFIPKNRETAAASFSPFLCYGDPYPEFQTYQGSTQWTKSPNTVSDVFQNSRPGARVVLQPGAMRKMSQYFTKTASLNSWFLLLWDFVHELNGSVTQKVRYGHSKLIAVEKMIKVGSENEVEVAAEFNQAISSGYSYKKNKGTLPIYE